MNYTENYNLKKPEQADFVDVDDLNDNADTIDSKLKANADAASAAQEDINNMWEVVSTWTS